MQARRRDGFTLLEIGIVLIVMSVLLGGMLGIMTQQSRRTKQDELKRKLDAIENMLSEARIGGRLPCPADGTLSLGDAMFGRETTPGGGCSSGTPAGTFSDGSNTVGGVLPVRALGLPDDYMFDPWGGRFTYIVDKRITSPNAFEEYWPDGRPVAGIVSEVTKIGSITLKDHHIVAGASVVSTVTTHAIVAIVSHGPNGHGAFQVSGVRKSAGSNNSDEQQNCHCNAAGTAMAFDSTIIVEASAINPVEPVPNSYDDIARFYSRASFLSAQDRVTEGR